MSTCYRSYCSIVRLKDIDNHFHRLVMISLAMLIVPYLPATNLFIHVGFVVAERVLYLPSSGWCFLFALGMSLMINHHKAVRKQQYMMTTTLVVSLHVQACAPLFIILILMFTSRSIQVYVNCVSITNMIFLPSSTEKPAVAN